jgi:hypothetical protein
VFQQLGHGDATIGYRAKGHEDLKEKGPRDGDIVELKETDETDAQLDVKLGRRDVIVEDLELNG